ncbi:hypothetical protein [Streptomyces sp. NPDC051563]|uniref:hypothetical protein n=1 Tax=Streptomyces sp. NPDC051563 TaxID=3365659 RepID=UPI0037AF3D92
MAALALRSAVTDLRIAGRRRSHRHRHAVRLAITAVAVTAVMMALLSRLAGSGV